MSQRLEDRREVAAGTRAQVLGFEDGRFYANGWHITGEMGGIVTPPLKLLDSVYFGVNGSGSARPRSSRAAGATPATSCRRSTASARADRRRARRPARRADRPQADEPSGRQQDRQGDGRRALRAHDAVPVGLLRNGPERERQRPGHRLASTATAGVPRHRRAPGEGSHSYTAIVGSDRDPLGGRTGPGHYGPFGAGRRCAADQTPGADAERVRRRPVRPRDRRPAALPRRAEGRRLDHDVDRRRGSRELARRGAQRVPPPDRRPAGAAARQAALARGAAAGRSSRCRATASCRTRSTGASRTSPTSRRSRPTSSSAGRTRARSGRRGRVRASAGSARASPTIRGCSPSTASTPPTPPSRSASSARSRTTCARCATSPTILNDGSGVVVHEVVADGSIWHGKDRADARRTRRCSTTSTRTRSSSSRARWR